MHYPFLIIDHDDTSVESTAHIHYPAHLEVMKILRPGHPTLSLDMWFTKNFHPGIMEYFREELLFSNEEVQKEYEIWRSYTETRVPEFYPGFLDAIESYQSHGGRVAVVSHSDPDIIRRDYTHAGVPHSLQPEIVFGWDADPMKRKPHPYPVFQIMESFGAERELVLVVDDLRPGVEMAASAGVDAAAAGWSHHVREIRAYMENACVRYFERIKDFAQFIID